MKKFVKPDHKGKKAEKKIISAACKGDLTAYVKHYPTGAMIPLCAEAVERMNNGETLDIEQAERRNDRYYFSLPFLAIRWGMETKDCLDLLIKSEVPCFFNPREVEINGNSALVGQDDICVFKEYVDALEENLVKKQKDIQPEFI